MSVRFTSTDLFPNILTFTNNVKWLSVPAILFSTWKLCALYSDLLLLSLEVFKTIYCVCLCVCVWQMMDFGFHSTLRRAAMTQLSADNNVLQSRQACIDAVNRQLRDLDQHSDKQIFLEASGQLFFLPQLFEFQPHRGDEVSWLTVLIYANMHGYETLRFIYV